MNKDTFKQKRQLDIKLSDNKLEAYISIAYDPDDEGNYPPKFSSDELKKELYKTGIIYGLVEDNLKQCLIADKVENILVARGDRAVDGKDDFLELKFEIDNDIRKLQEDSNGRVDFKSIGSVKAVLKGEVIAELHSGSEGIEGKDVTGKAIKPKAGRKIKLAASQGCELIKDNIVIAAIDGKPSMKNNTLYVYKTHEIAKDVDLKTGNISFLGDITINGSVKEGMKVDSGNAITILQDVERANVNGKGDIIIKGNVIASIVTGGGEDAEKLKEIEDLNLFEKHMLEIVAAVEEIKKFNLLGYNTTDGQIVKVLIENKFKALPKLSLTLLSQAVKNKQRGDLGLEPILIFVKTRLIGLAPLNIKHYSELFGVLDSVKQRLEGLKATLSLPVNVKVAYCQDSEVSSSGDIIVSGSGSYVSSLLAYNNIYFTAENSMIRGGRIEAGNEIKCKQVGSHGGVVTRLSVREKGCIWVDKAYENTVLAIGGKELIIDSPSKSVHAYLDDKNELVVDKLRL